MRLLDLFCGAGGAAVGYYRAGFDVVGVDILNQPHYPFQFIQANALEYLEAHGGEYDVIHASPPCQAFTKYKNARPNLPDKYPDLIMETRLALIKTTKLWVLENVVGAPVNGMIMLCGSMFGLDVRRHRLFECSIMIITPPCNHSIWLPNRFPGGRSRERGNPRLLVRNTVEIGRWNIPIEIQKKAMGIDWMELEELSEAIPPAYTEFIGRRLKSYLESKEARTK